MSYRGWINVVVFGKKKVGGGGGGLIKRETVQI
jgi:hypothetical protein